MNKLRCGFTLIEVMIVMLIMAIIAGLAVISVQGHIDQARWTRSFEQIEELDRTARISARRDASPYQITFDRSKRSVELRAIGVNASAKSVGAFKLPAQFKFDSFRKNKQTSSSESFVVEIAGNGQSPSYAVAIAAPSGPPQWLVTLGFSGQQIRMEEAKDVASMLR
jgi:prepilin-type N-terminal cleavage/methylation domain-containing protein